MVFIALIACWRPTRNGGAHASISAFVKHLSRNLYLYICFQLVALGMILFVVVVVDVLTSLVWKLQKKNKFWVSFSLPGLNTPLKNSLNFLIILHTVFGKIHLATSFGGILFHTYIGFNERHSAVPFKREVFYGVSRVFSFNSTPVCHHIFLSTLQITLFNQMWSFPTILRIYIFPSR